MLGVHVSVISCEVFPCSGAVFPRYIVICLLSFTGVFPEFYRFEFTVVQHKQCVLSVFQTLKGGLLKHKHKHRRNGSTDVHNTNLSTWACAEWIIALFSVPYLFDTVKQDGGLSLMLILTAESSHLT